MDGTLNRAAMNATLECDSEIVQKRSPNPARFFPFSLIPGNAADPNDTSICFH
jgi:hypothetical protein